MPTTVHASNRPSQEAHTANTTTVRCPNPHPGIGHGSNARFGRGASLAHSALTWQLGVQGWVPLGPPGKVKLQAKSRAPIRWALQEATKADGTQRNQGRFRCLLWMTIFGFLGRHRLLPFFFFVSFRNPDQFCIKWIVFCFKDAVVGCRRAPPPPLLLSSSSYL